MSNDIFSTENEVKANFMKWKTIGDSCKGVYVDRQVRESMFDASQQAIYTLVQEDKTNLYVHGRHGKPVKVIAGLESCKFGQEVGLRYESDATKAKPGLNPAKIIKVYGGEMKPEVLAAFRNATVSSTDQVVPF